MLYLYWPPQVCVHYLSHIGILVLIWCRWMSHYCGIYVTTVRTEYATCGWSEVWYTRESEDVDRLVICQTNSILHLNSKLANCVWSCWMLHLQGHVSRLWLMMGPNIEVWSHKRHWCKCRVSIPLVAIESIFQAEQWSGYERKCK